LASGLLLVLYAVGGVILLALLNGMLLTLMLRLFLDREQVLAARTWVVPLAFLLAFGELVLYERRRAQTADLIAPIRAAIQEALSQMPTSVRPPFRVSDWSGMGEPVWNLGTQWAPTKLPEEPSRQREPLQRSLKELQQLLASPDPEAGRRLASTLQEVLRMLDQLADAEKDRFRRLRTLLEQYQRRQPRIH
jgi:hypothetical protein